MGPAGQALAGFLGAPFGAWASGLTWRPAPLGPSAPEVRRRLFAEGLTDATITAGLGATAGAGAFGAMMGVTGAIYGDILLLRPNQGNR